MYNSQNISLVIKKLLKEKKISQKKMLSECGLNINYIAEMSKGKQPTISKLSKIANYFCISVDELIQMATEIQNNRYQNQQDIELLKIFNQLSDNDKLDVLNYAQSKIKNSNQSY